ncbi:MAG: 50S ribosomal protein L1 [Parcubacteria group bacterium GW2011_GWA2_56_7]|nr:MAG: 50S ribosomal protein L1 [Parcubacteria group bacterium GW2011_GWA2_56_7]
MVEKNRRYTPAEAIKLAKETSGVKFDASVEVHVRLGIDPSKSDQQIRGTMNLPHGTGKTKRVAAFVEPEDEPKAKEAGADIVGGEELVAEITKSGKINFDVAVATPSMMPKIAKIAKTLGQKGVMPNPKTDTVGADVVKMIKEQKTGKVSIKNDATGNVHQLIGRVSFTDEQLLTNYEAFMTLLKRVKPSGQKGIYIQNVSMTTAMGPGIKVEL